MPRDPNRLYDGFSVLYGGVNGGINPSLLPVGQCAFGANTTFRDGFAHTRPPWNSLPLAFDSPTTQANWTGQFQGAIVYPSGFNFSGHIVSRGGRLFRVSLGPGAVVSEITPKLNVQTTANFVVPALNATVSVSVNTEAATTVGQTIFIDSGHYTIQNQSTQLLLVKYLGSAANATALAGNPVLDVTSTQIFLYQTNPAFYDLVFMFTAENYVIVLAGQNKPVIFDGFLARLAGVGELPPAFIGVYINNRIWLTLPDRRSFMAGDILYGSSGTAANGFRDAILKTTENDFLNEGGLFTVPAALGQITSMLPLAQLDTSLGVGPLLIGTEGGVISVNAPADRTTWKSLTYPIQSISQIDNGPQSPRGTFQVNGDMWYRGTNHFRSFIVARRDMTMWGNTPMSREISELIENDNEALLLYGSGLFFDNRALHSVSPQRGSLGVYFQGLAAMNFDTLSGVTTKSPPIWEGVWTGLNLFQILKGVISGIERCFVYALTSDGTNLELWEILPSDAGTYDVFQSVANGVTTQKRTPIQWVIETQSMPFQDPDDLELLLTSELFLEDIVDTVTVTLKFRPDQYPGWTTWATIQVCGNTSQCTVTGAAACQVFQEQQRTYAARLMMPQPPEICNALSNRDMAMGYEHQFRLEITGSCSVRRFWVHARTQTDDQTGGCPPTLVCNTVVACMPAIYTYNAHGP